MSNPHFIHTTDWHLGFFQYNKPERFKDFYDAARLVVKEIQKLKPDFVLHTGDLFHHGRPSPGAIRQAVRLLGMLDKSKIPVYIVRGNHDGSVGSGLDRGGGIIPLLDDLEMIHFIDDEKIHLEDVGVDILGIGYYPGKGVVKKLDQMLEETEFLSPDSFKIVALHAFVEGQLEEIDHLPLSRLNNLGVDYIGVGHYHIPWSRPKMRIFVPGSTETTSTNDWARSDSVDGVTVYSSFLEIKAENNELVQLTHNIPVRPKIQIREDIKSTSVDTVVNLLKLKISEKIEKIASIEPRVANKQPIIDVDLVTDLGFDQISQVSSILEEEYSEVLNFTLSAESDFKLNELVDSANFSKDINDILLAEAKLTAEDGIEFLQTTNTLIDELGNIPQGRPLATDTFDRLLELFREEHMLDLGKQMELEETKGEAAE